MRGGPCVVPRTNDVYSLVGWRATERCIPHHTQHRQVEPGAQSTHNRLLWLVFALYTMHSHVPLTTQATIINRALISPCAVHLNLHSWHTSTPLLRSGRHVRWTTVSARRHACARRCPMSLFLCGAGVAPVIYSESCE